MVVSAFPLPARGWASQLLRNQRGQGAEEAEALLDQLPIELGTNLTHGQAQDLAAVCRRERVAVEVKRLDA